MTWECASCGRTDIEANELSNAEGHVVPNGIDLGVPDHCGPVQPYAAQQDARERAWQEWVALRDWGNMHATPFKRADVSSAWAHAWDAAKRDDEQRIAALVAAVRDVRGKLRTVPGGGAYVQIHNRHLRQLDSALRALAGSEESERD